MVNRTTITPAMMNGMATAWMMIDVEGLFIGLWNLGRPESEHVKITGQFRQPVIANELGITI
jgi:hypothetical protein